jgi:AcrR family transcriptional regulator
MAMDSFPRARAGRLRRESDFSGGSDSPEDAEDADSPENSDGPDSDGRHLRRSRNREAVVLALLELYREGNLDPSAADVAGRSGLSARSLFRYFDDVDDLSRAAIDHQYALVRPLAQIDLERIGDPLDIRVEALVGARINMWEAAGKVGLVARLRAPFEPIIAKQLAENRVRLRHQIELLFSEELKALGATRKAEALVAIDMLCSFESYLLLREQGMDVAAVSSLLTHSVLALLGRPAGISSPEVA